MKLIFCKKCQDIVRLFSELRTCKCGECSGRYINDIYAIYNGGENVIPIGFGNNSFLDAVENQPEGMGKGKVFKAFVIPKKCLSMFQLPIKKQTNE